ncbi:profilin, required for normal timing of actin polymerization in response to thermal stress, partial [Entomortierella beljakovae]
MSWQAYVDSNLIGTGKVSKACIYGLDGNQWATSPEFNMEPKEVQKIIAAFDNPTDLQENGVYLEGMRYIYLRSGDESIYARR